MSKRIAPYLDPIMNPGGVNFPVKRGTWDFIEASWEEGLTEIIKSIIGDWTGGVVYILYGCELSSVAGTTSITRGAIFYNGEIFIHPGSSFADPVGPNVVIANINPVSWQPTDSIGNFYADPVAFIGSAPANVHIDRTVTFLSGVSGSGTISGNTFSNFGNILDLVWGNDRSFSSLVISTGGGSGTVTGTLLYSKNVRDNTLKMHGLLTSATPSDFVDFPNPIFTIMGTLPVGYRPSHNHCFFSSYPNSSGAIKNFAGNSFITSFRCAIGTTGEVLIQWIKPDSAFTSYNMAVNAIVSLD